MSTSPAVEATKPIGESAPSTSQPKQNSSIEPEVMTSKQSAPVEPKDISIEPKLVAPKKQTSEEAEITLSKEQKSKEQQVISEISKSGENSTILEQKLPEVAKSGKESEKETAEVMTEIVEDGSVIGNKPEVKNLGQEPASTAVANSHIKTVEEDRNVTQTQDEKLTSGQESYTTNEAEVVEKDCKQKDQESKNPEQNEDIGDPECVNVQELTEHVMNILNDDVVDEVLTEQQLLKKNVDLQQFIIKLIQLLKEKTDLCANLDRQNSALISQAQSLKDVIAITKDLLGIRNMEIEHLHADLTAMEETIKEERTRYNTSVQRLNEAMSLNDKLKTEYLTQMDLFQKLRDKYNEKVVYLTRENLRLNSLLNPDGQPAEVIADETSASDLESSQNESVDK